MDWFGLGYLIFGLICRINLQITDKSILSMITDFKPYDYNINLGLINGLHDNFAVWV